MVLDSAAALVTFISFGYIKYFIYDHFFSGSAQVYDAILPGSLELLTIENVAGVIIDNAVHSFEDAYNTNHHVILVKVQ